MSRAQQRRTAASVVFRLLLALSLWEGPILWTHQHTADSANSAEHLARCHAHDPRPAELGWHWHVSLPVSGECPDRGADGSERPLAPRLISMGPDLEHSGEFWTSVDSTAVGLWAEGHPLTHVRQHAAFDNLRAGFRPHTTPQQVLSRLMC